MLTEAPKLLKPPKPLKLFYCYARENKAEQIELDTHLIGLKRSRLIASWSDQDISAGTEWETHVQQELATAHIILLLISIHFMASDYCYGEEMQRALKRHEAGEARVIPILLRAVDWEDAPFSKLQMLPSDAKPISRWQHRDDAFEDIAKGLRKVVKELQISLTTKEEWLEEGDALYDLKRFDDAIHAYDRAIALDPSYATAYNNKGLALYDLKRFDDAIHAYDRAIALDPSYAIAYNNKGNALYDLKRFDDAIHAYDRAIALDPSYVDCLQQQGQCALRPQAF